VGELFDALDGIEIENGTTRLPFDVAQVADSLRNEAYAPGLFDENHGLRPLFRKMYYSLRPFLPVGVRKYFQQLNLRGWERRPFPRWPVDCSVDSLFEQLMLQALRSQGQRRIPFIWFWPDGASGCAIMTHDVETRTGRDFCSTLMDINDAHAIKASFQIVPECRYEVPQAYLNSIRERGFEVNVQDLNHDGRLYWNYDEFRRRAAKINQFGRQWGALGFRAAVLYRQQKWFDALQFSYDMSVPNVAHLDPQRGGCCTVMPYFIGDILELPVTATQDYMIFHLLHDYSTSLWKQQTELILEKHGLANFIVHPDYIVGSEERSVYENLLRYLTELRQERNLWMPLPSEVNDWWRQRAEMDLVEYAGEWRIEGRGKERARLAYASEENGKLVLTLDHETADRMAISKSNGK
jgi:hypothetical protein